jgi:hypothetical protein
MGKFLSYKAIFLSMKIFSAILILIFFVACAPVQTQETKIVPPKVETKDVQEKPRQVISAEVKELIAKHESKISSIYYKYRGPETVSNFHEFYIKGDKIRYGPHRELKSLDQTGSYDSIFIDKTARTAQSYCTEAYCAYKGKKADLNYDGAYINTIFDWIDVKSANKVGEEVIDDRTTWKVQTDKGILWIDMFYGIPLKVDASGKIYKFEQISVNSVQDSDVMP